MAYIGGTTIWVAELSAKNIVKSHQIHAGYVKQSTAGSDTLLGTSCPTTYNARLSKCLASQDHWNWLWLLVGPGKQTNYASLWDIKIISQALMVANATSMPLIPLTPSTPKLQRSINLLPLPPPAHVQSDNLPVVTRRCAGLRRCFHLPHRLRHLELDTHPGRTRRYWYSVITTHAVAVGNTRV